MLQCKPEITPMNSNEKLQMEDHSEKVDAEFCRSMVGSLIYLTHSRPDIAHAVSLVSRFMQSPSCLHLGAVKRILRYVAGSIKFGLLFAKGELNQEVKLVSHSDSDWGGCIDDRKSISANVFSLGSAAITWSTKKQGTVALSITGAEYIAATVATCQAIWLRRILEDLHFKQVGATITFCDNQSTISLSRNPVMHNRSKHIELKHHFIREMVKQDCRRKLC
ncbi:putative RNA-directed DNA polymerase [Helianthus annuus]|nr:putative RNA-directed DNA polymerase [Helianthus annuus]